MSDDGFMFIPPPEAPFFQPTEEEFGNDPLEYISKIRPIIFKTGIARIRPPKSWKPPFSVDTEKFKFTPRVQRLYELEAQSRIKLNFINNLALFNHLQGREKFRVPNVFGRYLDLHLFHGIVQEIGGFDAVTAQRKWTHVAENMGYAQANKVGNTLKMNYEKILLPFDISMAFGAAQKETCSKSKPVITKVEDNLSIDELNEEPEIKRKRPLNTNCVEDADVKEEIEEDQTLVSKELRRLQFFGPGPKAAVASNVSTQPTSFKSDSDIKEPTPAEAIVCEVCMSGQTAELLLVCCTDDCRQAYHTFCLVPLLPALPKEAWHCPVCVHRLCSEPPPTFGFPQSQQCYNLSDFGSKADSFKQQYFQQRHCNEVAFSDVEAEFWRILQSYNDDVVVEYGADVHSSRIGSGFPLRSQDLVETDYTISGWNLNNLPQLSSCILRHIKANIDGMKVPWCYVGMVFSSFCWHIEDHWSYSINYLHWGEPKTWYGVSGYDAEKLEASMFKRAKELFRNSPDLLHHITTNMNPNILMQDGVPVYRTDQEAGDFVVTCPRAYHAGFNQGFNFAEAVNFCTVDWLDWGRKCIKHYSLMSRPCVFSHDELVFQMCNEILKQIGMNPMITPHYIRELHFAIEDSCSSELINREKFFSMGGNQQHPECFLFEELNDDERMCRKCCTTCFFSAVTCSCLQNDHQHISTSQAPDKEEPSSRMQSEPSRMSKMMGKSSLKKGFSYIYCVEHGVQSDCCAVSEKTLLLRFTNAELTDISLKISSIYSPLTEWEQKVNNVTSEDPENLKIDDVTSLLELGKEFSECAIHCLWTIRVDLSKKLCSLLPRILNVMSGKEHRSSIEPHNRVIELLLIDPQYTSLTEEKQPICDRFRVDLRLLKDADIVKLIDLANNLPFSHVKQQLREYLEDLEQRLEQLKNWRKNLNALLSAGLPQNYLQFCDLCREAGTRFNIDLPEFRYLDLAGKALHWMHKVEELLPQLRFESTSDNSHLLPVLKWATHEQVMVLMKESVKLLSMRMQFVKRRPEFAEQLQAVFKNLIDTQNLLTDLFNTAEMLESQAEGLIVKLNNTTEAKWPGPSIRELADLVNAVHEIFVRLPRLSFLRSNCWQVWTQKYVVVSSSRVNSKFTFKISPQLLKDLIDMGVQLNGEGILNSDESHSLLEQMHKSLSLHDKCLLTASRLYEINQIESVNSSQSLLLKYLLPKIFVSTSDTNSIVNKNSNNSIINNNSVCETDDLFNINGEKDPVEFFCARFAQLLLKHNEQISDSFKLEMSLYYHKLIDIEQSTLLKLIKLGSNSKLANNPVSVLQPNSSSFSSDVCFLCLSAKSDEKQTESSSLYDTPLTQDLGLRLCPSCWLGPRPSVLQLGQIDVQLDEISVQSEVALAIAALTRRTMQWLRSVEQMIRNNASILRQLRLVSRIDHEAVSPPNSLRDYFSAADNDPVPSTNLVDDLNKVQLLEQLSVHALSLLRVGLCLQVDVWSHCRLLLLIVSSIDTHLRQISVHASASLTVMSPSQQQSSTAAAAS